jgi:hypothetical protein
VQVDLRAARELVGLGVDGLPIDVLLDLRDQPEPIEGLSARFGRWWIEVCSTDGRPLPSVARAVVDGERLLQIRLLAELPGTGEEAVLAESTTQVLKHSVVLAEAYCQWRGADLALRCLDRTLSMGWEPERLAASVGRSTTGIDDEPTPAAHEHPSDTREPSNAEVLRWSGGLLATRMRHLGQKDRGPRWILGVRSKSAERSPSDAGGYSALVPPAQRFYADPFVTEVEGRHFLFFEDASLRTGFGVISMIELESDGSRSEVEVVLERPYHLSYPCVFTSGSDVFMIPETYPNRTIELYRAVEFPRRWVLERVLLDNVRAADPTILSFERLYWLFANVRTPSTGGYDELSVYFSETLDGTWNAHPRNPVVSDVRRARPAGRLFETDKGLWRPAQDCSTRYGGAIAFQNVTTLTEEEYEEVPVGGLEPTWEPGLVGVHTYNSDSLYEVVDGLRSNR